MRRSPQLGLEHILYQHFISHLHNGSFYHSCLCLRVLSSWRPDCLRRVTFCRIGCLVFVPILQRIYLFTYLCICLLQISRTKAHESKNFPCLTQSLGRTASKRWLNFMNLEAEQVERGADHEYSFEILALLNLRLTLTFPRGNCQQETGHMGQEPGEDRNCDSSTEGVQRHVNLE